MLVVKVAIMVSSSVDPRMGIRAMACEVTSRMRVLSHRTVYARGDVATAKQVPTSSDDVTRNIDVVSDATA